MSANLECTREGCLGRAPPRDGYGEGKLDLATAQRDIATDWIAAYKNYFHTDRPLAPHPCLASAIVAWQPGAIQTKAIPETVVLGS